MALAQYKTSASTGLLKLLALFVAMLLITSHLQAQTDTKWGQFALDQLSGIKYKISRIEVTNQGNYTLPDFNLNVESQIQWINKYIDVGETWFYVDGYFKSPVQLSSIEGSITGAGTGASIADVYQYDYREGYYYYYVYAEGGTNYVPSASISPVNSSNAGVNAYYYYYRDFNSSYTEGSPNLIVAYYDGNYSNPSLANLYTSSTPPTISLTGGATAIAVMEAQNTDNTAIGFQNLMSNVYGGKNTGLGAYALKNNTVGSSNIALGIYSLFSNTTGSYNLANGENALYSNTSGSHNIAVGKQSLSSNTTGNENIAIGENALFSNSNGWNNIAHGTRALYSNTYGYNNIATGSGALYTNTTGNYNIALGNSALYNNTSGYSNVALGTSSLNNNSTGYFNTALGHSALQSNTTGRINSAVGYMSMYLNSTGSGNTAYGVQSLMYSQTGYNNTAIGQGAMLNNNSGYYNVAMGYSSLYNISTGYYNTVIGRHSGFNVTTGMQNTILGSGSGGGLVTGNNNTLIGAGIGVADNTSNTVILADGAGNQRFYSPSSGNVLVGFGNNPADNGYMFDVNGRGRFKSLVLQNDASNTFNHRLGVYDASGVSYGMMLWNTNETSGDWSTMIYGPNQANRRISFGKVNKDNPTVHGDVTEGAYFDLDDWKLHLTNDIYVNNNKVLTEGNVSSLNSLSNYRGFSFGSTSNNLNDLNIASGMWVPASANRPSSGYGLVESIYGGSPGWKYQLGYGTDGNMFIRQNINDGGWTGWNTFWHSGNFNPSNYMPNNGIGDWQLASSSSGKDYTTASLELRESNFGLGAATAPRLSFHWGNVIASQIGVEASGRIAILNNPGTGYENLIANEITSTSSIKSSGKVIASASTGFRSDAFILNSPNPIWSFDNATAYGLAYYQGNNVGYDRIGFHFGDVNSPVFSVRTNGTGYFQGNIGVGTSTPENGEGWDKVLDVYGNGHSKILTSTSQVQTGIWSHNNGFFGSTTGGMVGTYSNHPFSIITNKTVKMTVKSNGYVGIGVSDPTERLTVDGNILTKGIKVNPESVPDYVFKPEYKLRSLSEVESFIKENSHLPEVPSESEVKKNGLELGEMSTTLLKKVEELTLYLIEMKKENENLKQRLEKLERNK